MQVLLEEIESPNGRVAEIEEPLMRITVSLPRELQRRFKAKAALEGRNMSQILRAYIHAYVGEYGPPLSGW